MLEKINNWFGKLPNVLSSRLSIFIYIFLFVYLVVFAIVCAIIPFLNDTAPSNTMQLILGNYTNVLSALGASLAAGAGTITHSHLKEMHKKHDHLHRSITEMHEKIDKIMER